MAKINPVKLKQDADKLEKAGKLDQAIALYRQIVDDNPRDWNTINKIGDLYAKLNKPRGRRASTRRSRTSTPRTASYLKAIAIWKKINKLDPTALEPYLNLADLYAKQGLMMEAKSQYQIVVDEYIKRGKIREAGDVLKKMAEIDPADLKIRSKLADLYTREGNAAKAVDEHVAIAEELNKKGHLAEALQVLEKGLKIDPKSVRLRAELARVHLVQKNYEQGGARTSRRRSGRRPSDTQVLSRLGEAYLGGQEDRGGGGDLQAPARAGPAGPGRAASRWAASTCCRDEFDQAYEQFAARGGAAGGAQGRASAAAALLQQIVAEEPRRT